MRRILRPVTTRNGVRPRVDPSRKRAIFPKRTAIVQTGIRLAIVLCGFAMGAFLGCGSSNTVEMPTNPTPKPKDPFFLKEGAPNAKEGSGRQQSLPVPAKSKSPGGA